MYTIHPVFAKAGRLATVTLLAASSAFSLNAQQNVPVRQASPALNLQAAMKAPINPFALDTTSSSTSSSSVSGTDTADTTAAEHLTLSDSLQPPPRRRYGRPRYTDSSHNPDGSNKYAFEVGGGFTLPTGGTHNYYKTGWAIQGGVGRNFNKNFTLMADFNWANFGIQTNTLNNLLATYNTIGAQDENGDPLTQLGGYGHVWSLSLDPIYNFAQGEKTGFYVRGGVGFYHKISTFTIPEIGTYCDYYYGCYQYQANQPIDSYTSNAVGVNGGVGFTYKLSRFSNTKLFAEAKYVYTANSRKPYSLGSATNNYFNAFPQNSAPTTFIPVTFGVRF